MHKSEETCIRCYPFLPHLVLDIPVVATSFAHHVFDPARVLEETSLRERSEAHSVDIFVEAHIRAVQNLPVSGEAGRNEWVYFSSNEWVYFSTSGTQSIIQAAVLLLKFRSDRSSCCVMPSFIKNLHKLNLLNGQKKSVLCNGKIVSQLWTEGFIA